MSRSERTPLGGATGAKKHGTKRATPAALAAVARAGSEARPAKLTAETSVSRPVRAVARAVGSLVRSRGWTLMPRVRRASLAELWREDGRVKAVISWWISLRFAERLWLMHAYERVRVLEEAIDDGGSRLARSAKDSDLHGRYDLTPAKLNANKVVIRNPDVRRQKGAERQHFIWVCLATCLASVTATIQRPLT